MSGLPNRTTLNVAAVPTSPAARVGEPSEPPRLIETLRVEPGHSAPLLEGHLSRLRRSCAVLGYPYPSDDEIHEQLLQRLATLDRDQTWRMRLLLSPDGGVSLEHGRLDTMQDPLQVVVVGPRATGATQWLQLKSTHRPWYEEAAQWLADHPHVFDVLYWNEHGDMCEGSRSNLYIQESDGRWLTPPLTAGALPGVQRAALLDAGRVEEAPISLERFKHAVAWRISNGLRGWRDVQVHY